MNNRTDEKMSKDRQEGNSQGMSLDRKRNRILNVSKTNFPNLKESLIVIIED